MSQYKKHGIILSIVILVVFLFSMHVFFKDDKKEDTVVKGSEVIAYLLKDNLLMEYPFESYAKTTEEKIMEILACMMQNESDFIPLLYKNTMLETVEIKENSACIHFSMIDYDLSKERKLLESLIYACTQFDEIKSIKIILKGEEVDRMPKGGLTLANTTRSFGINAVDTNQLYLHEGNSVTLYYTKDINNKTYYVPRSVRVLKEDDYEEIMSHLLKSPTASLSLHQPLAKKHVISEKSPYYEDGILHVYMNRNILNEGTIDKVCAEVLRRTFEDKNVIEMIQIHVNEKVYDINVTNS